MSPTTPTQPVSLAVEPNMPPSGTTTAVPSQNVSDPNVDKSASGELAAVERTEGLADEKRQPGERSAAAGTAVSSSRATSPELEEMEKLEKPAGDQDGPADADAADDDDDEIEYPGGIKFALITLALCLSVFLLALDNTIIATAIPKITDHFNSLGDVGWYASAYLLSTCALQLFFGRLYTFYPIKTVYLASVFTFELGSAVCGAAPTSNTLIVGRAIAGIGAGGIFAGALIIIAYTVPLVKRPVYYGIVGSMYGIASIAGPLLGGAFTDGPGWRWCFYINLPVGAITLAVIIFFYRSPSRKAEKAVPWRERAHQLDLGGASLFIIAIVCCLLALQWGGAKYPWSDWRIVLCLCLFGVLIAAFLVMQYFMKDHATIPFKIIGRRSVAAAAWYMFCMGSAQFLLIYWVPLWFQAIKGASALRSGIMTLPMLLAITASNIIAGVGTTVIGYYVPFYWACTILTSIAAGLLTTWKTTTGHAEWIAYEFLYGFGAGLGLQQTLITVQAVLPLRDVPTGTTLIMFMQTFAGALFVSIGQNIFNNRLMERLPVDAPGVNPDIILHVGATSLRDQVPAGLLHGVQLAYNTALTQSWYIAVAMTSLSVIGAATVEWKSVKGMKPGGGPPP